MMCFLRWRTCRFPVKISQSRFVFRRNRTGVKRDRAAKGVKLTTAEHNRSGSIRPYGPIAFKTPAEHGPLKLHRSTISSSVFKAAGIPIPCLLCGMKVDVAPVLARPLPFDFWSVGDLHYPKQASCSNIKATTIPTRPRVKMRLDFGCVVDVRGRSLVKVT